MTIRTIHKTVLALCLANLLLFIGHIVFSYLLFNVPLSEVAYTGLLKLDADQEISFVTWYAQSLLLLNAFLASALAYKAKTNNKKWAWGLMGAFILFLSVDEGVSLHEWMGDIFKELAGITSSTFLAAWTIPALIVTVILAILFTKLLWDLPRKTKAYLVLGSVIFLLGAVGMEWVATLYLNANGGSFDQGYMVLAGVEEVLENSGSIIIAYALLRQIFQPSNS